MFRLATRLPERRLTTGASMTFGSFATIRDATIRDRRGPRRQQVCGEIACVRGRAPEIAFAHQLEADRFDVATQRARLDAVGGSPTC
jgi:hypothetical protein